MWASQHQNTVPSVPVSVAQSLCLVLVIQTGSIPHTALHNYTVWLQTEENTSCGPTARPRAEYSLAVK